ncbi:ComEA family DNA-binding protein [Candidatus Enterococcus clewellii]|uniref:Helix-hairpin-helix DNA-binding motif class 1 domain-containing protein n=1 Tax=Candidatus Enterococcus clewellii TaxID=1834193 RepID=A0A242K9E1_9ENTE|nr:helix-hairpin-helix domain-containing protein [Enterococcus sp. 9E7_DIV0242]OTP17398.1 hypothetical protein A5888_001536 [Enterococcus sp. 9E7_DIV0242]
MKTKSMFSYLVVVGAVFGGALGFGNEQAEAKMIIEGNEETRLQFIPTIQQDGNLSITRTAEGSVWEKWSLGMKRDLGDFWGGEPGRPQVAYVTGGMVTEFDGFNEVNGIFRVDSSLLKELDETVDDTGYYIFDSQNTNQVNIGYTRTEQRTQYFEGSEETYENSKSGVLFSEAHSLAVAVDLLKSSYVEQGIISVHPVLRFEAALVQGDSTAQFAVGNNVNYNYFNYGTTPVYGGSESSFVYSYHGSDYQEFYLPFAEGFSGPTKMFIDVDAKTIGQQTEYSFRNFQVVLERYVPITMASYEELLLLDGIGTTLAQRIIDYRETTGFNSLDDLQNVKGIGPATIAKIKAQGLARVDSYFN